MPAAAQSSDVVNTNIHSAVSTSTPQLVLGRTDGTPVRLQYPTRPGVAPPSEEKLKLWSLIDIAPIEDPINEYEAQSFTIDSDTHEILDTEIAEDNYVYDTWFLRRQSIYSRRYQLLSANAYVPIPAPKEIVHFNTLAVDSDEYDKFRDIFLMPVYRQQDRVNHFYTNTRRNRDLTSPGDVFGVLNNELYYGFNPQMRPSFIVREDFDQGTIKLDEYGIEVPMVDEDGIDYEIRIRPQKLRKYYLNDF